MAPTKVRVAKSERRWGCRRGTPSHYGHNGPEIYWGMPMTLNFSSNVTSSVMRPFDSSYAISYWWSFGTEPLGHISNGFRDILPQTSYSHRAESSSGMHDMTMICTPT